MTKTHEDVWSLVEDLSDQELETLGGLIAGLNRVEMIDDAPRYDSEEMDLIGRFQDLNDVDDENTDGDDPIAEDNTENPSDGPSDDAYARIAEAAATVRNSDTELS
jgi:hypothetical protein